MSTSLRRRRIFTAVVGWRLVVQMSAPTPLQLELESWRNHAINCRLVGESRARFAASRDHNSRHELQVLDVTGDLRVVARINGVKVNIDSVDISDAHIVPGSGPRVARTVSQHMVAISNVSTLSIDYDVVRARPATPPPPIDNSHQLQPQPSPSTAASLTSTATTTPPSTAPAEVPGAAQSPAAGL